GEHNLSADGYCIPPKWRRRRRRWERQRERQRKRQREKQRGKQRERQREWLVLFGSPPDELQKRPWSAGRPGFAIQGEQSGRDLSNSHQRLSIFWRSSELADRLRSPWPRLHQWRRANQYRRRGAR